jgi:hypothetical protein
VLSRARMLGLGRPMHYALQALRDILGTPLPAEAVREAARFRAPSAVDAAMRTMLRRVLEPIDPACWPPPHAAIRFLLFVRSHWLRMPAHLLVPHLIRKGWRRRVQPATA